MSITFTELEGTIADVNARLPTVRGQIRQVALAPNTGEVFARLPTVRLFNEYTPAYVYAQLPTLKLFAAQNGQAKVLAQLPMPQMMASTIDLAPSNYALVSAALPRLQMSAYAVQPNVATVNAQLPRVSALISEVSAQAKVYARLPTVSGLIRETAPTHDTWILCLQTPGVSWAYGGIVTNIMADTLQMSDSLLAKLTAYLLDAVVFADGHAASARYNVTAEDRLVVSDALRVALTALMQDGLTVSDAGSSAVGALVTLLDALVLTDTVSTQLQALNTITDAIALADVMTAIDVQNIGDTAAFSEALTSALAARATLLDGLVVSDTLDNTVTLLAAISDTISLSDSITSTAQLFALIRDGVTFHSRLRINGETFIGHVVNLANRAFSTYTGLPFNAMAKIGDTYWGTGPDGLYRLWESDDADGEPIIAEVRSGLFKMSTNRLKRMPSAYLGLTADGRTVLKVVTTDQKTGIKHEWWYERSGRPAAGSFRNDRVKIGRGLRGEYWQWALVNADGADFSLDVVELFPMILESRL